jgi:hypothetical protein
MNDHHHDQRPGQAEPGRRQIHLFRSVGSGARRGMRVLLTVSLLSAGVLTAVVVGGATPASAATPVSLDVSTSGSDGNNCTSSGTSCLTIAHAIGEAESGSYNGDDVTINVAAGTYVEGNVEIFASSLN